MILATLIFTLFAPNLAKAAEVPSSCQLCELRYKNLSQRTIKKANYAGAYMFGSNLSWADVRNGNFQSTVLTAARMEWSDMDESNFSKATLEETAMAHSTFRNANFSMANLARANLTRSDLSGANFDTALMQEAHLSEARLFGASLRGANLTGADLSGARLRDADLQGATLKRADLKGSDLGGASFNGAILDNANLSAIEIRLTNFRSASLKNADFRNAVLNAVNFQNADLSGADFTGATIQNVLLQGANLCNAKLPNGAVYDCNATAGITTVDERTLLRSGAKNDRTVRISLAGNAFANFQKGRVSGIIAEAAAKVMRDQGQEPTFVAMPADAALKALEEGRLDAATVILKIDKIREKFLFSDPIINEYQVIAVKKGNEFRLKSLSDLRNKRIGARKGYFYEVLEKNADVQVRRYQSDGEMVRAMLQGEVDAILLAGISDIYALRTEGILTKMDVLRASVGSIPLVVAFSKARFTPDDVNSFNQRLATLKLGSDWVELLEKNGIQDLIEPFPALVP